MAEIVLFHSVLGPRPGVALAAERLRGAGHRVHTPDLYGGDGVFDDYGVAAAYLEHIGYPELLARAARAVERLSPDLVYAGFSNGGAVAEFLAATRSGARAALLLHAALPLSRLGVEAWPGGVPVQMHYSKLDPYRNQDAIDSLARSVRETETRFEFYEYPGGGHLFTDPSLPEEYDAASAELLWTRVDEFLSGLEAAPTT